MHRKRKVPQTQRWRRSRLRFSTSSFGKGRFRRRIWRRPSAASSKAIVERALGGELTHHLAYPPGGAKPEGRAITAMGRAAKRC